MSMARRPDVDWPLNNYLRINIDPSHLTKGVIMSCCCKRVCNRTDMKIPPQPQKGTWLAFGVRSVCTLTGAALGAVGGGYAAGIYARSLAVESISNGNERIAIMLAVSMPLTMAGGAIQGATVGAIAGCCIANRILARTGLSISS
jgi:hypothetical protein